MTPLPTTWLGRQPKGWMQTMFSMPEVISSIISPARNQPFGCLPNHVVGKGVIKTLKQHYPQANISAIDYDSSASEVNQLNRIKLLLSAAENRKLLA